MDGLVGVIGFIRRECAPPPPPTGGPEGAGGGGRSEVALLKLCRSDGCNGSWFLDSLLLFSIHLVSGLPISHINLDFKNKSNFGAIFKDY